DIFRQIPLILTLQEKLLPFSQFFPKSTNSRSNSSSTPCHKHELEILLKKYRPIRHRLAFVSNRRCAIRHRLAFLSNRAYPIRHRSAFVSNRAYPIRHRSAFVSNRGKKQS